MFEIELIICIKMELTLNNLQRLKCHKTQPTNKIFFIFGFSLFFSLSSFYFHFCPFYLPFFHFFCFPFFFFVFLSLPFPFFFLIFSLFISLYYLSSFSSFSFSHWFSLTLSFHSHSNIYSYHKKVFTKIQLHIKTEFPDILRRM